VSLHACDFKTWLNYDSSSHVLQVCHRDIICVNVGFSGCDMRSQPLANVCVGCDMDLQTQARINVVLGLLCAPCVGWGFWFGLTLHCVALLCELLWVLHGQCFCSFWSSCSECQLLLLGCLEAPSPPLLGPSTAERSRHSLVQVTFGATLLVAVGFAWAWLLFLLALGLGLGLGWSEVARGCLLDGRLG
jgi:hypothetical protein